MASGYEISHKLPCARLGDEKFKKIVLLCTSKCGRKTEIIYSFFLSLIDLNSFVFYIIKQGRCRSEII